MIFINIPYIIQGTLETISKKTGTIIINLGSIALLIFRLINIYRNA